MVGWEFQLSTVGTGNWGSLQMRPRISIRGSVRPSVRPFVCSSDRPSVFPSVRRFPRNAFFFEIAKMHVLTSVGERKRGEGGVGRGGGVEGGRGVWKGVTRELTYLTFCIDYRKML